MSNESQQKTVPKPPGFGFRSSPAGAVQIWKMRYSFAKRNANRKTPCKSGKRDADLEIAVSFGSGAGQ
jgi:hypothetical protein